MTHQRLYKSPPVIYRRAFCLSSFFFAKAHFSTTIPPVMGPKCIWSCKVAEFTLGWNLPEFFRGRQMCLNVGQNVPIMGLNQKEQIISTSGCMILGGFLDPHIFFKINLCCMIIDPILRNASKTRSMDRVFFVSFFIVRHNSVWGNTWPRIS